MVLATPLQRVRGGGEGAAADPGLHVQRGAAGARVLARAAARHRLRGQVRGRQHRQVPQDAVSYGWCSLCTFEECTYMLYYFCFIDSGVLFILLV